MHKKSNFLVATFDATALAKGHSFAFALRKASDTDIIIFAENTGNAYHRDIVEIEVLGKSKGILSGRVHKVIGRARDSIVGTYFRDNKCALITSISGRFHSDVIIINPNIAKNGQKVVAKISFWGGFGKLPRAKIVEVLGEAGDSGVDVLGIIKSYNLPLSFPEIVLEEAKELSDKFIAKPESDRKDLRNLFTFTIDPKSAKDYDDAISVERSNSGYSLFVHIADVSHFVSLGSALFKQAKLRGNSYYFPKRVIPMLPQKLSNGSCSLRPNEDKYTLTVKTIFDKDCNILSQSIFKSITCSNVRLCYDEVDKILETKTTSIKSKISKKIFLANEISKKYFKKRDKYIKFSLPDTEIAFNDDGGVRDIVKTAETGSHKLIENFMLIANEFVAKFLSKNSSIYRVHEAPDPKVLRKLQLFLYEYNIDVKLTKNLNKFYQKVLSDLYISDLSEVLERKVLRSMKKARYDVKNLHHFGLGLKYYTHFTSPIRRISDLLVHMLIKKLIKSKRSISEIAGIASEKEMIASEAEAEVKKYYILEYMRKRVGNEYKAIVIDITKSFILAELYEKPIFVKIPLRKKRKPFKKYLLGNKITVQIVKVDQDILGNIIVK